MEKKGVDPLMKFEFTDKKEIMPHSHSEAELFYVLGGEAELNVGEESVLLAQDDFFVVNTNKRHSISGKGEFLAGYIHIDYRKICGYLDSDLVIFLCNSTKERSETYNEIRKLVRKIFAQYFERKGIYGIYLEIFYYQLLFKLVNHFQIFQEHPKFKRIYGNDDERRINFITAYIESRYAEKITLSELAQKLYLSDTYFSKYMKQKFGMSFLDYLNDIRMYHALDDMVSTDKSLTRIAMDNGFANTAIFNRVFKKTYHMLPSEYQRNKKQPKEKEGHQEEAEFESKVKHYIEYLGREKDQNDAEGKRQIYVDVQKSENFRNSSKIVNIGTMENLLNSNIQKQIVLLKQGIDFEYARFWGLYSKELYMIVDLEQREFNFNKIDRGLDFLLHNKIKPFIELGMKPFQIIKTLDKYMMYQEPGIIFRTPEEYVLFIKAFVTHCINRYGEKEVASWYFEDWHDAIRTPFAEYWEFFEAAYRAVKSCFEKIRFGGAGYNMSRDREHMKKFMKACRNAKVKPDFISLNSYHYVPYAQLNEEGIMDKKWKRSMDSRYLYNQIATAKELIDQEQMKEPVIIVTEWNLTNSSREVMNDGCFKGAYVMKNMIDTVGCVDMMGYWTVLDAFSEHYDSRGLLDGSGGILTRDGIFKPAYYAFEFMEHMGPHLLKQDENCLVTSDGYHNYFAVCHNYKNFSFRYYLKSEEQINMSHPEQLFDDYEPERFEIYLDHIENGMYRSQTRLVNDGNGSILDEWMRMGKPQEVGRDELEYLRGISVPRIFVDQYEVGENSLRLQIDLMPNEIRFIEIRYIH